MENKVRFKCRLNTNDPISFYGAEEGSEIIVFVMEGDEAVWANRHENPDIFKDPNWVHSQQLCISVDSMYFGIHFTFMGFIND